MFRNRERVLFGVILSIAIRNRMNSVDEILEENTLECAHIKYVKIILM